MGGLIRGSIFWMNLKDLRAEKEAKDALKLSKDPDSDLTNLSKIEVKIPALRINKTLLKSIIPIHLIYDEVLMAMQEELRQFKFRSFIHRDLPDGKRQLEQNSGKDIIFGSTKKSCCDEFEALIKSRFQMSSMGELTFFLGLQVKQKEDGIFIRFHVTPKDSHLSAVKRIFRYLKGKPKLGLWYPKVSLFDLEAYSKVTILDGQKSDRKYTNRRDAYEKKLIQVLKIHTDDNVADLLTKAFDVSRFQFLVVTIGMIQSISCISNGRQYEIVV
ncbi:hypothetical protein Tco_0836185 [Tanacetum coccineum]